MSETWFSGLDRTVQRISGIGAGIASLTLLVLLVASVADSLSRTLSSRAVPGVLEASENLLVGTVFLALAYAYRCGAHVSVEGIVGLLPRYAGQIVVKVAIALTAAVTLWIVWETGLQALASIQAGEMRQGTVQMPVWPARLAVPIGFAMLFLESIVALLRRPDEDEGHNADVSHMV